MRKLVYLLLIIGLITWKMACTPAMNGTDVYASIHAAPSASDVNFLRTRGHSGAGNLSEEVALTFDDGPQPVFTPQILSVLHLYGVHATFFGIGSQIQKYPASVRHIYQDGNIVGNHTWSHPDLTKLSSAAIRWQISSTSTVIQQATGAVPTLFRPPYGATNASVRSIATQLGLAQTEWTIDTNDWQRPGVDTLVSTVLTQAHDGSIILMHDGGGDRSQTVRALPQIIKGLQQRGFAFATL